MMHFRANLCSAISLVALLTAPAAAQNVELVSVAVGGGVGNGQSLRPRMSSNGRFVVFDSTASNLVALDTNGTIPNLFLRDRLLGTTEIVSRSSSGGQFMGWNGSVSSDGRFVVFQSSDAIESSDTDLRSDVWRLDRQTGAVQQVSLANDAYQYGDAMTSDDGRVLAYGLEWVQIFGSALAKSTGFITKNLQTGAQFRFEGTYLYPPGSGKSYSTVRLSADGAWAYSVEALYGPTVEALVRVSTSTGALTHPLGFADLANWVDAVSADGRYLAVNQDTGGMRLWDLQANSSETVNLTWDDASCVAAFDSGVLSDDARYVGFRSSTPGMVQGGGSGFQEAYLRDRATGSTLRVSLTDAGQPLDAPVDTYWDLTASADAIAFSTAATNVTPGDTNGQSDVFVRTNCLVLWPDGDGDGFGAQTLGSLLCLPGPTEVQNTADCDDGNAAISPQATEVCNGIDDDCDTLVDEGVPASYCTSQLTSSACLPLMTSSGTPSLASPGAFSAIAFGLEDNQNGLQFFGTTGAIMSPFFGHVLCVNSPLYRLDVKSTAGHGACTGSLVYTLADVLAHPVGGALVTGGQFVHHQAWFRDPPSNSTIGMTNGLVYTACP